MRVTAPDPIATREATLHVLRRLRLPLPPPHFPLVWERGDKVDLRPLPEIEARLAILNVTLARSFGMPTDLAMEWLLDAHLIDQLSPPETRFVLSGIGDRRVFLLHLEAMFALSWLVGVSMDLDPAMPVADGLVERMPNLPGGESFAAWRRRTLAAPREPREAATALDLYYCADWAYLQAEKNHLPLPGMIDSNTIGQRRWALEWAVIFVGPYHDPPRRWEGIDLSV